MHAVPSRRFSFAADAAAGARRPLNVRDLLLQLMYPLKHQTHHFESPPAAGDESVALVNLLLDVLRCLLPEEKRSVKGKVSGI